MRFTVTDVVADDASLSRRIGIDFNQREPRAFYPFGVRRFLTVWCCPALGRSFVSQRIQFLFVNADRSCPKPSPGGTFARRRPIAAARRMRSLDRDTRVPGRGLCFGSCLPASLSSTLVVRQT